MDKVGIQDGGEAAELVADAHGGEGHGAVQEGGRHHKEGLDCDAGERAGFAGPAGQEEQQIGEVRMFVGAELERKRKLVGVELERKRRERERRSGHCWNSGWRRDCRVGGRC